MTYGENISDVRSEAITEISDYQKKLQGADNSHDHGEVQIIWGRVERKV